MNTPVEGELAELPVEPIGKAAVEPTAEPVVEAVSEPPADPVAAEPTLSEAPTSEGPAPDVPTSDDPAAFEDLTSLASEAMAEPDGSHSGSGSVPAEGALSLGASRFTNRDPHDRARRLARVLVSDIIAYYPTRYRESFSAGTLKEDFHDEVTKSWKEYVDQVGEELAESTSYFTEALNEILARGEEVF